MRPHIEANGQDETSSSSEKAKDAGADSPHLDKGEQNQAADHSSPHALIIHEVVREEGETALERSSIALTWSALAAGLSMGFSFLTMAVMQAALPHTAWATLLASVGYSVGFVIVVLGKQQLFTESTLTVILPVLVRRDLRTLLGALRVWSIVLPVNLIGTAIFAWLLSAPDLFDAPVVSSMHVIARETISHSFDITFLKALFAGWLIALMVWLLPSAGHARLFVIILITYVVSITKLSHIIAGSAESIFGLINGDISIKAYLGEFLLPTLLGNVLGGISLVGLLNHAAIAPEIRDMQ